MNSHTLSWLKRSTPADGTAQRPHFRPTLDVLEDRTVLSTTPLVNLPLDVGPVTAVTNTVNGQQVQQLQAPVTIAGQQAGMLVMDATTTAAPSGGSSILNLHVQPISLNLLGLHVDTSAICLDVTAHQGQGVLGDLLSGLGSGLNLSGILGQLNNVTSSLNTFLGGVEHLLDGALGQAMTVTDVLGTPVTSRVTTQQTMQGNCDILNLSLGPIDLNLLGLNVALDNCNNGPVTVDVTADPKGGLLGNLLCGLADGNLNGQLINRLIGRLDNLIDRIGGLADRLDDIAALPGRFERIADRLIDQLERVASRADTLTDLDRLINRINRVTNQLDRLINNTDAPRVLISRLEALENQLSRIVNRFQDLGLLNRVSLPLERVIDQLMSRL